MAVRAFSYQTYNYEHFDGCPVELGDGWSFIVEYVNNDTTRMVLLYREPDEHVIMAHGNAYTHPDDTFCRRKGRKVAFQKCLSGLARPVRAELWRLYLQRFGVR